MMCSLLLVLNLVFVAVAVSQVPDARIKTNDEGLELVGKTPEGRVTVLEASDDLVDWAPDWASADADWNYKERLDAFSEGPLFFRVRTTERPEVPADGSLKTSLKLPDDSLFSPPYELGSNVVRFAKFTILLDDLATVYFQDSDEFAFHYQFAVDKIPLFSGMSPADYSALTNGYDNGRERLAVLGSVILDEENERCFIEFVGLGDSARFVEMLYRLVESRLEIPTGFSTYLHPGDYYSRETLAYLNSQGIYYPFGTLWGNELNVWYVRGWALGRLNFVRGDEVESAYESGELLPTDILMTDSVPNDLPFVTGVITMEPVTPNSHVAILARAYDIPFVYVEDAHNKEQLLDLIDEDVFIASEYSSELFVRGLDELNMDEDTLAYFKGLKSAGPLEVESKQRFGSYAADVIGLTPDDVSSFGGKASNFGFLLREIPENTRPDAVAFSIDLWDDFMAQEIESGLSLGNWIEVRLSGYRWEQLDLPALYADLKTVRDKIEDEADFSQTQRGAVLEALEGFDIERRIRFRSSTNVEDAENYSGAGLYDSKSGCLADELDGDTDGPSLCEPDEENEKGVFRAMRKVYASFYNENAFLERLRLGVVESQVGMGILAHYSYPDEIELANGVIVYDEFEGGSMEIVSQLGAESVANPEPGVAPEIVDISGRASTNRAFLKQASSRVGSDDDYVLGSKELYDELAGLVDQLVVAYLNYHDEIPAGEYIALDFEYKFVSPGLLEIKQLRRIPTYRSATDKVAYVGGRTTAKIEAAEGGIGTALGLHYLKSEFVIEERSARIDTAEARAQPLIQSMRWTRVKDGEVVTFEGDPLDLPDASFRYEDGKGIYEWNEESGGETIAYTLRHLLDLESQQYGYYGGSGYGIAVLRGGYYTLSAKFENARYAGANSVDGELQPWYRSDFSAYARPLQPQAETWRAAWRQVSQFSDSNGVSVEVDHWLGDLSGTTKLLLSWNHVEVKGLVSEALVFTTDFSRTQAQAHHHVYQSFVFDPWLEPSISQETLRELEAKDVKLILVTIANPDWGADTSSISFVGLDGIYRDSL